MLSPLSDNVLCDLILRYNAPCILVCDRSLNVVFSNELFNTVAGGPPGGQKGASLLCDQCGGLHFLAHLMRKAQKDNAPIRFDSLPVTRPDGAASHLDGIMAPLGQDGAGWVACVASDATARCNAEFALLRKQEELEGLVAQRTAELREANARLTAEMTNRRTKEAALQRAHKTYLGIFEYSAEGIICCGIDGRIREANRAAAKILGFASPKLLLETVRQLPDDLAVAPEIGARIMRKLARRGILRNEEIPVVLPKGTSAWLLLNATFIRLADAPGFIELIITDITDRKQNEQSLFTKATRDHLTGVLNRFMLKDSLHQLLHKAQRYNQRLGLLYIDIDSFKAINDTYGHAMGDEVLIETVGRITRVIRKSDIFGRMGGDEFCLIMEGVSDPNDAKRLASTMIDAFSEPVRARGHELTVSISIGISIYPLHGTTPDDLLCAADKSMYQAKFSKSSSYHINLPAQDQEPRAPEP